MINAALGRFEVTIQAISPPTIKTCGMSREITISGQLLCVHRSNTIYGNSKDLLSGCEHAISSWWLLQ